MTSDIGRDGWPTADAVLRSERKELAAVKAENERLTWRRYGRSPQGEDMIHADVVAALRRIAADNFRVAIRDADYERMVAEDFAILRAVVAALDQAKAAYSDSLNHNIMFSNVAPTHDYWVPVWIILVPEVKDKR